MKIAMLGQKRIPSREGGVEIVVEELSTRMVKSGHEVTCYNRGGKHALDKNVETSNLKEYKGVKLSKCFTIDKKGLAAMTSSFFATIKAIFSKNEVIHYHAEGPCAWMWLVKWFTNKKIVATIHGLDWQRAKWGGFATKYIKFGEKCAVKYADEIIVLSKNVQQYFKDTYNRETVFIPNGVNKPEIVEADIIEKEYNLKKDDYILFLGRIVPEKGIHYLIDAYNDANVDKKLVIAGGASDTDTYYAELKEKAKDNKNIIFTGFVQGRTLEELYSNAYIYCLPSDLEGMPLSLLEGMSYKNCCLTSDIKECSEVVEDKAVTFKKGNVKDLTKKLQQLCKDKKEVQQYKKEAQAFITKKYNWDDVVDKTLDVYEKKKPKTKIDINNKQYLLISLISTILLLFQLSLINDNFINCFSYILFYIINTIIIYVSSDKEILNLKFLFFVLFSFFMGVSPVVYYYTDKILFIEHLQLISMSTLMYTLGINTNLNITKQKDKKNNEIKLDQQKTKKISYLFVGVSILATTIYLFKNFDLLFGGNIEAGRIIALSGNGIILQLMSLGVIGLYLLFEHVLEKQYSLLKFIVIAIIVLLCTLTKGFRTAIIGPALVLMLMYNKKKKIPQRKVITLILTMFVAFIGLGIVRNTMSGGESDVFNTILYSIRNGSDNLDRILYAFGNKYEFQHGSTYLINIKMMLPGPDKDFTLWLKDMLQMNFDGGGVSPSIIAELYMNFNKIGVYFGMLIVGIIGNIINNLYKNSKFLSYTSFLAYIYIMINSGGIANIEVNLLITTMVYIGVIFMCKENSYAK